MHKIVVRVATEVNTKSSQVKVRFLRRLIKNMKAAFRHNNRPVKIEEQWSRLYVSVEDPADAAIVGRVFGVGSYSLIEHSVPANDEAIKAAIAEHYGHQVGGKTVCLRVRRLTKVKTFKINDKERELGGTLAQNAAGVDLSRPDFKLQVEYGEQEAFLYSQTVKGPGGLPLGIEGHALCLFSGGFDSAIAAWEMMKRGVSCDFVLFNMGGKAYEESVIQVARVLADRWIYGYKPQFFVVDFDELTTAIRTQTPPRLGQVILKRCFYRLGESLLARCPEACALITGEAIGQVSSQTLPNIVAIDQAITTPILRPLLTAEKEDIIRKARAIGTYEASEVVKEYCAITPKHPVTRSTHQQLTQAEAGLDLAIITDLAQEATLVALDSAAATTEDFGHLLIDRIPDGADIIDTRSASEFRLWHWPGAQHQPLEPLSRNADFFADDKTYILICDIGMQTNKLVETLQARGIKAFSFRGGAQALRKRHPGNSDAW